MMSGKNVDDLINVNDIFIYSSAVNENTLEKQILKKWAFQQWLLRPRYCHGVFAT